MGSFAQRLLVEIVARVERCWEMMRVDQRLMSSSSVWPQEEELIGRALSEGKGARVCKFGS